MPWKALLFLAAAALLSGAAVASDVDDDLWILAAGRGAGGAGSMWMTDLVVLNAGEDDVEVEISFLDRSGAESESHAFEIAAGQTLVLPDVTLGTFGLESAFGSIRVEAVEDEEEDADFGGDEVELIARARIYEGGGAGTFGQTLDGLSDDGAISADGPVSTLIAGVSNDASFRTNWIGLNVADGEDDEDVNARVLAELLDVHGETVGSREYGMPAGVPVWVSLADFAPVSDGTLRLTMLEGEALFVASRIDMTTNDPATLAASVRMKPKDQRYTDEFRIEDCTFASTGENPFFPLRPGLRVVLEGEDDGADVQNVIEVLGETFVVDGVTTRVITETESEDGELTEISRNYFAQCVETGAVFYFGEHVDIYEDGEVVSHEGEWLAGQDGARAGIIMPGTVLAGSRYYQEVAPGVALDRAEHLETGLSVETEIGELEGCASIRDTSALDPGPGDVKVYCPGIGVVIDAELEIVEVSGAP